MLVRAAGQSDCRLLLKVGEKVSRLDNQQRCQAYSRFFCPPPETHDGWFRKDADSGGESIAGDPLL